MGYGADGSPAARGGWVAGLVRRAGVLAASAAGHGRCWSGWAQPGRQQGRIDTLIGAGTSVRGPIAFSGGLRVDGDVEGDIVALPGDLSVVAIGRGGRLRGAIRASRVVVNGSVCGSIVATGQLELLPGARVSGELRYAALEIHPGAVIDATARREAPERATATPAPAARPGPRPVATASPA